MHTSNAALVAYHPSVTRVPTPLEPAGDGNTFLFRLRLDTKDSYLVISVIPPHRGPERGDTHVLRNLFISWGGTDGRVVFSTSRKSS